MFIIRVILAIYIFVCIVGCIPSDPAYLLIESHRERVDESYFYIRSELGDYSDDKINRYFLWINKLEEYISDAKRYCSCNNTEQFSPIIRECKYLNEDPKSIKQSLYQLLETNGKMNSKRYENCIKRIINSNHKACQLWCGTQSTDNIHLAKQKRPVSKPLTKIKVIKIK